MTGGAGEEWVVVLRMGSESNLIHYLISIHEGLWYDKWGGGGVVGGPWNGE